MSYEPILPGRRRGYSKTNEAAERRSFESWAFLDPDAVEISGLLEGVRMRIEDLMPLTAEAAAETPGTADDQAFAEAYPRVWLLCTSHLGSDGKKREVATMVFFVDEGLWKVRLSERNTGHDLWAGGSTFDEALRALENRLCASPVPWRKAAVMRRK